MNILSFRRLTLGRAGLGAVAMAGLLSLPVRAASEQSGRLGATSTNMAAKADAAKAAAAKRERQTEVRKGIELLERAKAFLQYKDAKLLGGRKEKTVDYIERAIKELRDVLEADK